MNDADALLLENSECAKEKRLMLSKIQRSTLIAIKCVDKPNVHSLRELVSTTLPMVGHIGRVGELVLEKNPPAAKEGSKTVQQ